MKKLIFLILFPCLVIANVTIIQDEKEIKRINLLVEIIALNLKTNGWNNMITFGHLPNLFYERIKVFPFTFITSNSDEDDYYIEHAVKYSSNFIIISCLDFDDFETSLRQTVNLPYWHPLANIIILYQNNENKEIVAKSFFALYYYRAINAIVFQHDDDKEVAWISDFSPFVNAEFEIESKYGCWTAKNIGIPVYKFDVSLVCVEKCHNISVNSKLRASNLGTCIGFDTYETHYENQVTIANLNLFYDKGKNFHGYTLRAFSTNIPPFTNITLLPNETYILNGRDGMIWNHLTKLLNVTLDLRDSYDAIRKPFNFETNIQQIFGMAHRKADVFLIPIYQFDVVVVEVDYTFAFKESGVCFMSHRAGYEMSIFDVSTLHNNYNTIIEFIILLSGIWMVFVLYSNLDANKLNIDLIGKSLMNTIRNALLINLVRPPTRSTFRIFLTITIWSFFVISFSTQAAIISLFTAARRGKDVDTFDDIVEKGYKVEGMASPDIVLPDTEERFRKINSKLVSTMNMLDCVNKMLNDSQRFCLIDCSLGRYLQRNKLNSKGEKYLHIAKDRVHSHYLNMVLQKHSVLTEHFNRYMMMFFEAGLIKKWEHYRFNDFKEDAPVKALSMEDFQGIMNLYICCVIVIAVIFLLEVVLGNIKRINLYCKLKFEKWNRTRIARKIVKVEKKHNKIKLVNNFTQTAL